MVIQTIFPVPIGLFRYEGDYDKDFILKQEQQNNVGNRNSKDNYILEKKELEPLFSFIQLSLNEYFQAVFCPEHDVKLKLTQSWINWTRSGEHHHKHNHANSLISGCFYVNANKNTDRISFYNEGYKRIKIAPKTANEFNASNCCFPVQTGDLLLFPSELEHMVELVDSDEERVSLAFNAFPIGFLGDSREMTVLEIN